MNNETILVLGPKGKTGRKVLKRLIQQGFHVRAVSRSTNPSFDWMNSESWSEALEGINRIYLNYPMNLAEPGAIDRVASFANTAVNKGVKRIVMLSGRGEPEARAAEEKIRQSGAQWTILRSDWFFQNFSENFLLYPILEGDVILPRENTKIPFIDTDDIADAAVAALITDDHIGKTYELTGPALLTLPAMVQEISEAIDKPLKFKSVSVNEYVKMLKSFGLPKEELNLVKYLFGEILDGRNSYRTHGIEMMLGRMPKTFSTYVAEMAEARVWQPTNV